MKRLSAKRAKVPWRAIVITRVGCRRSIERSFCDRPDTERPVIHSAPSAMEIEVAPERAFRFKESLSLDEAAAKAWARRLEGFGPLAKMAGLLQPAKSEDFELLYQEHRYVPFWHIACVSSYQYVRRRDIPIAVDRV